MTWMSINSRAPDAVSAADATTVLKEVRRRIVGMHASVAERLNSDPDIVPWVERALRDLMRYINDSGAAPMRPSRRPDPDDESSRYTNEAARA